MASSIQDSKITTTTTRRFECDWNDWADEEDWGFSKVEETQKETVKRVSISKDSRSIIKKTFGVAGEPATKEDSNLNITFKKSKKGKKVLNWSSQQESFKTEDLQKETRFPAMLVGYKCGLRSDQDMRKYDGNKRDEELRPMYQLHFLILGEPIKENYEGKKYVLRMARGNLAAKWALGYKLGDIGTVTIGDIKKPDPKYCNYDCVEPLVMTQLPQGFWLNRWGEIPDIPTWNNHDKESRGDFSPEHARKGRTHDITWVRKTSIQEINKTQNLVVIEAIWNYIETYKQYKYPHINNLISEKLENVPEVLLNYGTKPKEATSMASALRDCTVPLPVAATQKVEQPKVVSGPESLRSEAVVPMKRPSSVWKTFDRTAMFPMATAPEPKPEPEQPIQGLRREHLEDILETVPEIKLRVMTITKTGLPFLKPIQNFKEVPVYRDSLKTMNWDEVVPKGGGVISMEEASKNKFPIDSIVLGRVIWNFSAKGGVGDWNVYISEESYRPKSKPQTKTVIPFKIAVPKKEVKLFQTESSSFAPELEMPLLLDLDELVQTESSSSAPKLNPVKLVQTESSTNQDGYCWLPANYDWA